MKIHEFQAKMLFAKRGIPVQRGIHVTTVEQALNAWKELATNVVAVKSQIHAGGRGKGTLYSPDTGELVMEGGVHIAKNSEDVEKFSSKIFGNKLVTIQTGPEGKIVNNIYIESGCDIAHEYYLAVLVDREEQSILVMASTEGGMDIEEVAEKTPEKIVKTWYKFGEEVSTKATMLGKSLKLEGNALNEFELAIQNIVDMFWEEDCAMIEINPMVRTNDNSIVMLDAKVSFDDNASFRRKDFIKALRDESEEIPTEIKASEAGLSYVKLDGDIGCLVNGAGLAMATMDVIKLYGGEPANFLDVGGGANEEQVRTAFEIILDDSNVKGILVNIFGGIMRCDIIARGIIAATKSLQMEVPLVVRLVGTNFMEGREILKESGLKIHPAESLAEGAKMIVELIGE